MPSYETNNPGEAVTDNEPSEPDTDYPSHRYPRKKTLMDYMYERRALGRINLQEQPIETWAGQYAFYNGVPVLIGEVMTPDDPDDGPGAPISLDLQPLPAVQPSDDEVQLFKAIWELSNDLMRRGLAKGSRTELALGVVLALHDSPTDHPLNPLTQAHEDADIDTGATPEELEAAQHARDNPPQSRDLDFGREDWVLILAALRATAKRTQRLMGSTPTLSRLNQVADDVMVHLSSETYNPEMTDQTQHLIETFSDPDEF